MEPVVNVLFDLDHRPIADTRLSSVVSSEPAAVKMKFATVEVGVIPREGSKSPASLPSL